MIHQLVAFITAVTLFVIPVPYFLQLWWPLSCPANAKGSCDFEPAVALLGVALAALVHAVLVAAFAWSPVSAFIVPRSSKRLGGSSYEGNSSATVIPASTSFNTFLYISMLFDTMMLGYSIRLVEDSTEFLQAAIITLNAPILICIPYLLAAYRDPSSTIGRFLHRVKYLASSRTESSRLFDFDEADPHANLLPTPSSVLDHAMTAEENQFMLEHGLDRVSLLSPASRHDQREADKMRPFPRGVVLLASRGNATPDVRLVAP